MTSVTIFNANNLDVTVQVNNGQQFGIAGSAPNNWTPNAPSSGGPTWSNTTIAPNVMAPGTNYLTVTPMGTTQPITCIVNLPGSVQWITLQLYIFFNSYTDLSWIVLNNGQFVTGDIKLSSFQAASAAAILGEDI